MKGYSSDIPQLTHWAGSVGHQKYCGEADSMSPAEREDKAPKEQAELTC